MATVHNRFPELEAAAKLPSFSKYNNKSVTVTSGNISSLVNQTPY